jgi:hypothetical protein
MRSHDNRREQSLRQFVVHARSLPQVLRGQGSSQETGAFHVMSERSLGWLSGLVLTERDERWTVGRGFTWVEGRMEHRLQLALLDGFLWCAKRC